MRSVRRWNLRAHAGDGLMNREVWKLLLTLFALALAVAVVWR
jgi:hypothetical protein